MRFTLSFDCNNAAFGEDETERAWEVCRILQKAARTIEEIGLEDGPVTILDANGNRVGMFEFERDADYDITNDPRD